MKHGLVIEGGAMRGIFAAGVMDVLMENGIEFDKGIGVSAGACFGCNYKSKQNGRAIRYNLRFCRDERYCSVRSLIKTGDMFGAKFCYDTIPNSLDHFDYDTYRANPMSFHIVCTDVETGRPIYKNFRTADREDFEWLRASASMPFVSRIVEVNGRKLLDGGISDSIPLWFMEEMDCKRNVVILTQPRGYVKKKSNSELLARLVYRKYPKLVKSISERPKMYNEQLKFVRRAEVEGRAFVIAPPFPLPIGHVEHDPDKLLEVYRIGRKTANKCLDKLIKFMNKD